MPSLAWEQRPELRRPVLVAGFEGWNDAASAASEAAGWLTRQFGATKMASMDPEEHFDFQSDRPTGIVGVLHDTARSTGVASASLWAPVPHYVSTPPNPLATRALLDRLAELLGTAFELGDLDELSQAWQTRVDEVVSQDDDVSSYVGQLEERYDTEAETDVPSGEGLADEVEQFLRDRGDD